MILGDIIERTKRLPSGAVAGILGFTAISHLYTVFNFNFLLYIAMYANIIILLLFTIKIIFHWDIVKEEYSNALSANYYGFYPMLLFFLGNFFLRYSFSVGKTIWLIGISIHIVLIILFTYYHFIKNFDYNTFLPSWLSTYVGLLIAVIVGKSMKEPFLLKIITSYGLGAFFLMVPFMAYRLYSKPPSLRMIHTNSGFLASLSTSLVSYLAVTSTVNLQFLFFIYGLTLLSIVYILKNLNKYFLLSFKSEFGTLAFPIAASAIASYDVAIFFKKHNLYSLYTFSHNVAGIKLFLATVITGAVLFHFSQKIFLPSFDDKKEDFIE